MIILGIDPGTATTGWGTVQVKSQKSKVKSYGAILTDRKLSPAERLLVIKKSLCDIIKKEEPDCLAVEELFFFKNQKTIISVAQSKGVILATAQECGLKVYEYTPLQIKQALTGYGRADKQQIQKMVKVILGLKEIPKPDDAADALAVAICHAQTKQSLVCANSKFKINNA